MSIYLTAIIKSKPEFTAEVKDILEKMAIETRKEAACVLYDLHQGIHDENVFVFYEIWENQAGLDNHNQQPYIKEFVSRADTLLSEMPTLYPTSKVG
ncbi:putative quinol monooxygenase [Dyadobacter sp.]|uniref:putative quinol monooxygenase n=1 Tax=Dyadobacter sp. TaxID=1914288 RepID=UPI003F72CD3E